MASLREAKVQLIFVVVAVFDAMLVGRKEKTFFMWKSNFIPRFILSLIDEFI